MPRRIALALLAAGACLLGGPAAAHAATGPVDPQGADVQTALAIAATHWGATPCGGNELVAWVPDANAQLNAMASWTNPLDAWLQPLLNTDCVVALNPNASWDWPKLCTIVAHETGHLLGHPHSADPDDLMAPIYIHPIAECAGTPEPEGTLTAAAAAAQQAAVAAQQAAARAAVAAALADDPPTATTTTATDGDDADADRADGDDDDRGSATRAATSGTATSAGSAADAAVRGVSAAATPAAGATARSRSLGLARCLRRAARRPAARRPRARSACRRAAARATVRAVA